MLDKTVPGPEEHIYNTKGGYSGKDAKRAQINAIKKAIEIPHKPYKTMTNEATGKPELHVLMHRGVSDLDPNAEGPNKLKVTDSHIVQPDNAVHALYHEAAHKYADSEMPESEREKSGLLSFWVPASHIHGTGQYYAGRFKNPNMPLPNDEEAQGWKDAVGEDRTRKMYAKNPQAADEGHIAVKPGKYARATKDELVGMHNKGRESFIANAQKDAKTPGTFFHGKNIPEYYDKGAGGLMGAGIKHLLPGGDK
jgi:hypothetical protein